MKRLLVLVEGQTEEVFVRDVLAPALERRAISTVAVLLKTKRVKSGGTFRGGVTSTAQVLGDLRRLLGDGDAAVTTMLDYYGLPGDFPGMSTRPSSPNPHERVAHVETELARAVENPRHLVPHIVLHEFESWVFAAPAACRWVFDDPGIVPQLEGIAVTAGGAERINEGPRTAPSKRLKAIFPGYEKTLHGPMAVGALGLGALRSHCPHAAEWIARLEALGVEAA